MVAEESRFFNNPVLVFVQRQPSHTILYFHNTEAFFDYGNSRIILKLVQFASRSKLKELSENVAREALQEIILVSFLYAGSFSLVLLWFIKNINRFTQEIMDFTRSELNIDPTNITSEGPLDRMRKQFQLMSEQVKLARQKEQESNRELKRSLDMVEKANAQLAHSEKMAALGGLVAGVAHEINTPLGIGFTSISHLGSEARETNRRYREGAMTRRDLESFLEVATETSCLAETNLKRAADLVRSFKLVAVDQTSAEQRSFNVEAYLNEVLLSLRPKLKKTPYQISLTCPNDLVITSYPGAFSQILTNLVINSLEHGFKDRDQGNISIWVLIEQGNLLLRYRDDGVGISPKIINRIFEPFFTTTRGQGGSGLGMNMVYNLVTKTLGWNHSM